MQLSFKRLFVVCNMFVHNIFYILHTLFSVVIPKKKPRLFHLCDIISIKQRITSLFFLNLYTDTSKPQIVDMSYCGYRDWESVHLPVNAISV